MVGQPKIPDTPSGTNIAGKTAIVTGSNAGIGYEVARQLAVLGAARVIVTVRSHNKGEETVAALRTNPAVKQKNPSAKIEYYILDLDDYKSASSFVDNVKAEVPELDILILNGGVNVMSYQRSKSGHERVFQVNCLSNFFIILKLLPLLRTTAAKRGVPSRITFTGSSTQTYNTLAKRPLASSQSVIKYYDDQAAYQGLSRYADSKLIVHAFVRKLASLVPASEVVINDPCPGLVDTGFDVNLPLWLKPIMFVFRLIMARSPEEGARTIIYSSVVTGLESHGKFYRNNMVDPGAVILEENVGKEFMDRLWKDLLAEFAQIDSKLQTVVDN